MAVAVDDMAGPDDGPPWLSKLYGLETAVAARSIISGSPADIAAKLRRYRRTGATDLIVMVTSDEPVDQGQAIDAGPQYA